MSEVAAQEEVKQPEYVDNPDNLVRFGTCDECKVVLRIAASRVRTPKVCIFCGKAIQLQALYEVM